MLMKVDMGRQRKETVAKTARLLVEIATGLEKYADDQLISENSAFNQLLREVLLQKGYLKKPTDEGK